MFQTPIVACDAGMTGWQEPDTATLSCEYLVGQGQRETVESTDSANIECFAPLEIETSGALDAGPDGMATPADLIQYQYLVRNHGVEALSDVVVSDPSAGAVSCPSGNPIPSLGPGASETCTPRN